MKVSFDFDFTIWDSERRDFIVDTILLLREHLDKGDDVCILTSRGTHHIPDVQNKLDVLGLGHLRIWSAPGGLLPTKADVILAQSISLHFDDMSDHDDLAAVKNRVKEPPATSARHRTKIHAAFRVRSGAHCCNNVLFALTTLKF